MNPLQDQMQELDNLLRIKLEGQSFPVEEVRTRFTEYLGNLLKKSSLANFKCDISTYEKLIKGEGELSLYAISFLINRYFEMKPEELEIGLVEYYSLLAEVSQMSVYWNKQVEPIHKQIQADFATRQSLTVQQQNKMANPNLRLHN